MIADLLVNDYGATPVGTALLQTCGNLLEVVVAVLLLRRLVPDGAPLRSIRALMGMLAALAAGAAASATVGSLAQLAGDVIAPARSRRSGARGGSATSSARWSWSRSR